MATLLQSPSAFTSFEQRVDILPEASHRIKAHGLIGFAAQIALDPLCDLGRQPGFAGGLKKGKVVELVVFVIDHCKPGDPG